MLANMGLPMVFVFVPTMLVALLPIAFVEAMVFRALLPIGLSDAWRGALKANLASTLLGLPFAWFLMVVVEVAVGGERAWGLDTPLQRLYAVTVQAPWLIPYRNDLHWMIPAASLFLLVPFCFVSVLVEYLVLRGRWKRERLMLAVFLGNVLSYTLLAGYYGLQLYFAPPWSSGR